MLKKLVALSFFLITLGQIKSKWGYLPPYTYTDKTTGCKHRVTGSWNNQCSTTYDRIISCPDSKNPKIGTYTSSTQCQRKHLYNEALDLKKRLAKLSGKYSSSTRPKTH